MPNARSPVLTAVFALALVGGFFYYLYEIGKPKFDWRESAWKKKPYDEKNDQPYGTRTARRLLENYFPDKNLVEIRASLSEELPAQTTGSNYVFMGEALDLDSLETARLLDFVAAGNTAFLSSKTIPNYIMHRVYADTCTEASWGDYAGVTRVQVSLSLRTPALPDSTTRFFFAHQNEPLAYEWHYIPDEHFCDAMPQYPLGYLEGDWVNFAHFPHGKGRFLLHTTPLAFTNFSLSHPAARPYAEGVFSHLTEGDIYWDAANSIPEHIGRRNNGSLAADSGLQDKHILSYVLKQPALAWAWYVLAGLALAWLLFRAKRRQRAIPVLPRNENSSYEFISTIAHLHFREKNYAGLSALAMRHFLAQLRERYGLVVSIDPLSELPRTDDLFFKNLATRSELPESEARRVFGLHANTVRYQPTEDMAMELHLALEAFLKTAK
jgi:hypothetical protein